MLALEGLELPSGPNWDVAVMSELVQEERLVSLSSDSRNDEHPEVISVGMSTSDDEVVD
jgi:hypothetical protein